MQNQVSHEVPDWSREALRPGEWNPGKRLLASLRDYQRLAAMPGPVDVGARSTLLTVSFLYLQLNHADHL